jgi:hypothetical protein
VIRLALLLCAIFCAGRFCRDGLALTARFPFPFTVFFFFFFEFTVKFVFALTPLESGLNWVNGFLLFSAPLLSFEVGRGGSIKVSITPAPPRFLLPASKKFTVVFFRGLCTFRKAGADFGLYILSEASV